MRRPGSREKGFPQILSHSCVPLSIRFPSKLGPALCECPRAASFVLATLLRAGVRDFAKGVAAFEEIILREEKRLKGMVNAEIDCSLNLDQSKKVNVSDRGRGASKKAKVFF